MSFGMNPFTPSAATPAAPATPATPTVFAQPFGQQGQPTPQFPGQQTSQFAASPAAPLFGQQPGQASRPAFGQPTGAFGQAPGAQPSGLFSQTPMASLGATGGNLLASGGPNLLSRPQQPSLFGTTPLAGGQGTALGAPSTAGQSTLFGGSTPLFGGAAQQSSNLLGSGTMSALQPSGPQTKQPLFGNFAGNQSQAGQPGGAQPMFGQSYGSQLSGSHINQAAWNDPHGLSWLYPNEKIEELLKKSTKVSEPASVLNQIVSGLKPATPKSSEAPSLPSSLAITLRAQNPPLEYRPVKRLAPESREGVKAVPTGTFDVTVVHCGQERLSVALPVTPATAIKEIRLTAAREFGLSRDATLVYEGKALTDADTVRSAQITANAELILLNIRHKPAVFTAEEDLPKLERLKYWTSPKLVTLARMSKNELEAVKDFTIGNKHGRIVFPGLTNVTGLDLDEIVHISKKKLKMYPDTVKPRVGEGLNKPAEVHLFHCKPKKKVQPDVFESRLKKFCEDRDAEFIAWDPKEEEWIFKVKHF